MLPNPQGVALSLNTPMVNLSRMHSQRTQIQPAFLKTVFIDQNAVRTRWRSLLRHALALKTLKTSSKRGRELITVQKQPWWKMILFLVSSYFSTNICGTKFANQLKLKVFDIYPISRSVIGRYLHLLVCFLFVEHLRDPSWTEIVFCSLGSTQ